MKEGVWKYLARAMGSLAVGVAVTARGGILAPEEALAAEGSGEILEEVQEESGEEAAVLFAPEADSSAEAIAVTDLVTGEKYLFFPASGEWVLVPREKPAREEKSLREYRTVPRVDVVALCGETELGRWSCTVAEGLKGPEIEGYVFCGAVYKGERIWRFYNRTRHGEGADGGDVIRTIAIYMDGREEDVDEIPTVAFLYEREETVEEPAEAAQTEEKAEEECDAAAGAGKSEKHGDEVISEEASVPDLPDPQAI